MAEDKLYNQDLANLLTEKHGVDKNDAEAFIREFFLLIEEALEKDRVVKIKGLGTFKLVDVKSRESINVNTGERFEIQGHTKVSFTPDATLRDIINKPFAHFETVVLKENVKFEDEELISEPAYQESDDEDMNEAIEVIKVVEKADEPTEEILIVEKPQEVILSDEIAVTDIEEEKVNEVVEEEVIIPEEPTPVLAEDNPVPEEPEEPVKPVVVKPATSNRTSKMFMIITVIAAVVICSAAVLFSYFPTFMDDLFGYKKDRAEVAQTAEVTPQPIPVVEDSAEAIQARNTVDSLLEATKKESNAASTAVKPVTPTATPAANASKPTQNRVASKPVVTPVPKPIQTIVVRDNTPVRPDSTSYDIIGTKTQHTIQAGETLTRVSLRFYGTKDLWPYLVMHNRTRIPNPNVVPVGTTISIPELQKK